MTDPNFVEQAKDLFETRDSSVTSIFVTATPDPTISLISLQGLYKKTMEHRSSDRKEYPVSIPVARLKRHVQSHGSRATVSLSTFRLIGEMGTWKTWGINDVKVHRDMQTHDVAVEFNLTLDSESIGVESFNYTADLYLSPLTPQQ